AQLAVSFRAPGAESAQMTGVAGAVDAYALRWREAERTACADTHVRRVQSEARLDERTACLERRRLELGQAIRLMLEADSAVLANSMRLVHSLEWIETCSDPRRTEFARRVPDDPQARAAVAEVWGQLGRARLLELSGRYAEAAAMAATARDAARDLGEDSSFAAAHVRLGSIKARMGDYPSARAELLRGIQLAESASDDQTSVDGWIRLLWVAGVELQDGQGETWGGFARAALDRLGDDPMREAQLDHNLGGMAYREARFEDALAHYQRALDTQQRLLGDDDPRVARTLNHIANVLLEMRVLDRALDYARRSLEIRKRVLGAGHPQVAASLNNIASAHLGRQAYAEAGEALAQSLAITEGTGLPQETVARALSERLTVARTTQAPASHGR
ncbi:MAG: tetratricopeptide repeat protein, partial [Myxococcota bacterium]